jgi:FKBP-type peptidyl-prolyl cis-trans isomerase
MRHLLLFLLLCMALIACHNESTTTPLAAMPFYKNTSPFDEATGKLQINQLQLKSQEDTVSYALGIAWANGIGRFGFDRISYSFYLGAFDCFANNTSFIDVKKASDHLDKAMPLQRNEQLPALNNKTVLQTIRVATPYDTLCYELGYLWGLGAKNYGIKRVNPLLLKGLVNGLQGDTALFSYARADRYLRTKADEEKATLYASRKLLNEQWLETNKQQQGVQTLSNGVQYKVLAAGHGKPVTMNDVVVCHYRLRLIDHSVIENTYNDGQPLRMYPFSVVKGYTSALLQMKEGDKWEICIPAQLAYGAGGMQGKIPPFATLIYETEILKVDKP